MKHGLRTSRTKDFLSFMKRHVDWATRALTEFAGPVWDVGCVCGWNGKPVRDLKEAEASFRKHEQEMLVAQE